MKKIMMTMAATVVALTMNAQGMYVGGSLGFNTKSHDGNTLNSSFSIIPEFGVNFNEKMAVGMEIGYSHDNDKTNKSGNTGYELKTNTFKVAPYFRYTAVRMATWAFSPTVSSPTPLPPTSATTCRAAVATPSTPPTPSACTSSPVCLTA